MQDINRISHHEQTILDSIPIEPVMKEGFENAKKNFHRIAIRAGAIEVDETVVCKNTLDMVQAFPTWYEVSCKQGKLDVLLYWDLHKESRLAGMGARIIVEAEVNSYY